MAIANLGLFEGCRASIPALRFHMKRHGTFKPGPKGFNDNKVVRVSLDMCTGMSSRVAGIKNDCAGSTCARIFSKTIYRSVTDMVDLELNQQEQEGASHG